MKKVKTKRLLILSRSVEEMEAVRNAEPDPEMKKAYGEMVDLMKTDPKHPWWGCDWKITLRSTGEVIGGIGFKGGPGKNYGGVEVGYGIDEAYQRQGYGTEACEAMADWAMTQRKVRRVWAQTEPDNAASQKLLLKAHFVPDGMGSEGPAFRYAPKMMFLPVFLALGVALGFTFGFLFGNTLWAMPIGAALGILFGVAMDRRNQKGNPLPEETEEDHGN